MNKKREGLTARTIRLMPAIAGAIALMMAPSANALIDGSIHDFSASGFSQGEICIVCHTPHNADTTVADAPLWNHEVTASAFTVYGSATLDALPTQPDGVSKLCLSCHDGSVAVDSFGGTRTSKVGLGTTFISDIDLTGRKELGTDLSDDHPVSFTFDTALSALDGELFDPSITNSGFGSTIDADMLFAGKVQCASCHDVHDHDGNDFILRKPNTGSDLCLTCHDK